MQEQRFDSWFGKIPHAEQKQSLRVKTAEAPTL